MTRLLCFLVLALILTFNSSTIANVTYQPLSKIGDGEGGIPAGTLPISASSFGYSITGIGDIDSDGIDDLAVGAPSDQTGHPGGSPGAVYILLMHINYTVKGLSKIANGLGGLPNNTLEFIAKFGSSLTLIGDVDGDGVNDIAIGAIDADSAKGEVYILLLTSSGNVKSFVKIGDGMGGLANGTITSGCTFGRSVAGIGDLNGDGFSDLAVTSICDIGEIHILNLDNTGNVIAQAMIANGTGINVISDVFGWHVTATADLDGDGNIELLVGASGDDTGGSNKGAVYLLYMMSDGTVKNYTKLAIGLNGITAEMLTGSENFGRAIAWLSGLELNNEIYVIIGADDDTAGTDRGAIYIASLTSAGMVNSNLTKIADGDGLPAGTLSDLDEFGWSVANLPSPILNNLTSPGQLGQSIVAIGAWRDSSRGAVYIARLTNSGSQSGSSDNGPNTLAIALGVSLPLVCCCLLLLAVPILILISYLAIKKRRTSQYVREKRDLSIDEMEDGTKTNMSIGSSKLEWGSDNWRIDYQAIKMVQPPIATGSFGVVNKAKYRGTTVAVKTLIGNTQYEDLDEFEHEVELLKQIHHPNIVLFMGATEQPQSIVTEFVARGSLCDVIQSKKLKPQHVKPIALGMAQGMAYLHGYQPPVIHRDLKSQNILITKDWLPKIADFGISRTVDSSQTMTRRVGTTRWTAPEVLEGGKYTEKADVYSYGIILWEILAGEGEMPFSDQKWEAKVEAKILEGERPEMPKVTDELQPVLEVMKSCWAQSANDRPTFDEIVQTLES